MQRAGPATNGSKMMIKITLLFFGMLGAGLSASHHYENHLARGLAPVQQQDAARATKPAKTACRLKSTDDVSQISSVDQLDQLGRQ